MSDVEQFLFGDHQVRVVDLDGEPWWIAKDVCEILGYDHTPSAVRRLDEDEFSQFTPNVRSPEDGRPPQRPMTIVNEPGLYSLIFGSTKDEAKAFKRWITHEVLPAIRRTGSYQPTSVEVDSAIAKRLAEMAYKEHVVPGSARVLAFQRWRNPAKGMEAFGEVCVQLELDLRPLADAPELNAPADRPAIGGSDLSA
jgi:prophage antirepressor-like protein